jgi:hypothetical protein
MLKFCSLEAGQIVSDSQGIQYRVASTNSGPHGSVISLSDLQGKPVHLSAAAIRRIAYNHHFDLYILSYIERYNQANPSKELPYPLGPDGQPFRWSRWFQSEIATKLITPVKGPAGDDLKDEAIHEMIFTVLGQRKILDQFRTKIKSFHKDIGKLDEAKQLTVFLCKSFRFRVSEMNEELRQQKMYNSPTPDQEISMWQPVRGEEQDDAEQNILDTEEHGSDVDFESPEAKMEVAKFRKGFARWVEEPRVLGPRVGKSFITLFDIYWELIQQVGNRPAYNVSVGEHKWKYDHDKNCKHEETGQYTPYCKHCKEIKDWRAELANPHKTLKEQEESGKTSWTIKRGEIEEVWKERTGLGVPAMKNYLEKLPWLMERYITLHADELGGENSTFVSLMSQIDREIEEREETQPTRSRPAKASSVKDDIAEATSEVVSPVTIDNDIQQPTVSVAEAGKTATSNDVLNQYFDKTADAMKCKKCGKETPSVPAYFSTIAGFEHLRTNHKDLYDAAMAQSGHKNAGLANLQSWGLYIAEQATVPGYEIYLVGADDDPEWFELALQQVGQDASNEDEQHQKIPPKTIPRKELRAVLDSWIQKYPKIHVMSFNEKYLALYVRILERCGYRVGKEDHLIGGMPAYFIQKAAKLIAGKDLTPEMRKQVENAFVYRWTSDNPHRVEQYSCSQCDIADPYVNEAHAEGHSHPTVPLTTDDQWIAEHAFHFTNRDKLRPREFAEPAYLAPPNEQQNLFDPKIASVEARFAMEKTAYNPGKLVYMYDGDLYCTNCAKELKHYLETNGVAASAAGIAPALENDPDKLPQGPFSVGESDYPDYCGNCGEFLENPLTTDGYENLRQAVEAYENEGSGDPSTMQELIDFYPEVFEDDYTTKNEIDDATQPLVDDAEKTYDTQFLRGMGVQGAKKASEWQYTIRMHCDDCDWKWYDKKYDIRLTFCPMCGKNNIHEIPKENEGEFKEATEPLQQLRPDITPGDTGRLPHARKEGAGEVTKVKDGNRANRVVREIRDFNSRRLGFISENYDGTPEDMIRVAEAISDQMFEEYGPEVSNGESGMIATDETGQPRWRISPNFRHIEEIGMRKKAQNPNLPPTPGNNAQPMAVPDAPDSTPGPHSPNAPYLAPRNPGIQPRIVNAPPGVAQDDAMSVAASIDMEEPSNCLNCNSPNIILTHLASGVTKFFCPDCGMDDEFNTSMLGPCVECGAAMGHDPRCSFSPANQECRCNPGTYCPKHNTMSEEYASEPEWNPDTEDKNFLQQMKIKGSKRKIAGIPEDLDIDPDIIPQMSEEAKERYLIMHDWQEDNEHHGPSWWLQKKMWFKKDYEEEIPYQSTDDAIERELQLQERAFVRERRGPITANAEVKQAGINVVFQNEKGFVTDFGKPLSYTIGIKKEEYFIPRYGVWTRNPGVKQGRPQVSLTTDDLDAAKQALGEPTQPVKQAAAPVVVAPANPNAVQNPTQNPAQNPVAPTVSPNVVQNQSIAQPAPVPQQPGAAMAIMPGQENDGAMRKKTIEPELQNAKYHMSAEDAQLELIAAEEEKLEPKVLPQTQVASDPFKELVGAEEEKLARITGINEI